MYETIFKNGQEYVVVEDAEMPVYQVDPRYRKRPTLGSCANCSWHSLTDEQKQEIVRVIEEEVERTSHAKEG